MNLGTKSGMRFMEPNLGPDIILLDKRVAFFLGGGTKTISFDRPSTSKSSFNIKLVFEIFKIIITATKTCQ